MHLIVDGQPLQDPDTRTRGIGRLLANLLHGLLVVRPEWRIETVLNEAMPAPDALAVPASVVRTPFRPILPMTAAARDANERYFGEWLCARAPDVVLEANFFEGTSLVPMFPPNRPPLAGVAHDLIPILFHRHYLPSAEARAHYGSRLRRFAEADIVLANSVATQRDVTRLMRWPEERVVPILGAPDVRVVPPPPETGASQLMLSSLRVDSPFILYVGGADRRKNLDGALAAFAALPSIVRDEHLLVIVCALSRRQKREVVAHAKRLGIQGRLRLTGFVDDDTLGALYGSCRVSVFPSFYEGLGLPILESLFNGAPVVASDRSAIPEFAGPVSRLVDPANIQAVADAIQEALEEPRGAREDERRAFAASFTWQATAERAADGIARVRERRRPIARARRPRVAWVSPLPPTPSGIADYSAELLGRLGGMDIEPVISPQSVVDRATAAHFRVIRSDQIHERHAEAPFDLFVYHLGNSDHHVYMLEAFKRYSGLTVLHDINLTGLAFHADRAGLWPWDIARELKDEGHAELSDGFEAGQGNHRAIAEQAVLNGRIVRSSEAVVVHNAWSWNAVRSRASVPLFRIPLGTIAATRPTRVERSSLGLSPDRFVVVTLGEVTTSKRVDRLIDAVARLPDRIKPRVAVRIVGEASAEIREALLAQAARAGLSAQVEFVGRVHLDQLTAYASLADACVQLRYPHRGETSAALLRALSAGSACIVSDAGSLSELADSVALKVRTPPDDETGDLAAALVRLHDEPALGDALRDAAARYVAQVHDLDAAARAYGAAIHLTIARRRQRDGEWVDAVSTELAAAAANVPPEVFTRWGAVRSAARRARF